MDKEDEEDHKKLSNSSPQKEECNVPFSIHIEREIVLKTLPTFYPQLPKIALIRGELLPRTFITHSLYYSTLLGIVDTLEAT